MQTITFIPHDQLVIAKRNVRRTRNKKEIESLAASIKVRGVLQPLIVRPQGEGKPHEIVEGGRRNTSVALLESRGAKVDPLPCIVRADLSDCDVTDVSLVMNIERKAMDPLDAYEAFARLRKDGVSVTDIATRYGQTERVVNQRLALGRLNPTIRSAIRKEDIDWRDARLLSNASPDRQGEWAEQYKADPEHAVRGWELEGFVYGARIKLKHALFAVEDYDGPVVGDLFADEDASYVADPEKFWSLQDAAIAAEVEALEAKGWTVRQVEGHFESWSYEKASKKDGGAIYVERHRDGQVKFHKGYAKRGKGPKTNGTHAEDTADKPETTGKMETYLAHIKRRAVQAHIIDSPPDALRLLAVSLIGHIGGVRTDSQEATPTMLGDEAFVNLAEQPDSGRRVEAFAQLAALLGRDTDDYTSLGLHVLRGSEFSSSAMSTRLFETLAEMSDEQVIEILCLVAAELVDSRAGLIEWFGTRFGCALDAFEPGTVFTALLHGKATIEAVCADAPGDEPLNTATMTGKAMKAALCDRLAAEREAGRHWTPRWLRFPAEIYDTGRLPTCRAEYDALCEDMAGDNDD